MLSIFADQRDEQDILAGKIGSDESLCPQERVGSGCQKGGDPLFVFFAAERAGGVSQQTARSEGAPGRVQQLGWALPRLWK